MPNKTLYVKDLDLPLWEQAQSELGESVSSIFADCLRQRLANRALPETSKQTMSKLTVRMWNKDNQPVIQRSFVGRWLVGDGEKGMDTYEEDWQGSSQPTWSVAETPKGAIVVYETWEENERAPILNVFGSFEEFKSATIYNGTPGGRKIAPPDVIAEVASALSKPYEIEMDI